MSRGAGAGAAAGAATGGDAGQANGDARNGQDGGGVDSLMQALDSMAPRMESMRSYLQTQPWAAPHGEQPGYNNGYDGYDDGDAEGPFELSAIDQELGLDEIGGELFDAVSELSQQQMAQYHQQHVAPLEHRLQDMQSEAAWRDIAAELPDLADPSTAREVFEIATTIGQAHGWPAEVATAPEFVRLTYLAAQAVKHAQEEGLQDVNPAHLEGGSGSSGAQRAASLADQITGPQPGGRSVLPF